MTFPPNGQIFPVFSPEVGSVGGSIFPSLDEGTRSAHERVGSATLEVST